jgi:acetate kinase
MKLLIIQTKLSSGHITINYAVFDMPAGDMLVQGRIEGIGDRAPRLIEQQGETEIVQEVRAPNCGLAVSRAIDRVLSPDLGIVEQQKDLAATGYHVAHGGEKFKEHCIIDERVLDDIRRCIPLAPLHNPYNLIAIEAGRALLPGIKHVAIFDTCFHLSMPDYAYIYGIPYEHYVTHGIRRYGFDGISHKYMATRAAEIMGRPLSEMKLITCHLGDGASLAAIRGGKCVDTSMGFTPLEGLLMATRCGDLDPSIVTFLMEHRGCHRKDIDEILYKRSGLLGISSLSDNIHDLLLAREEGSYRARLAVDIYCYRLKKYIASYLGVLEGADAIIFSGPVGESCPSVRKESLQGLSWAGISLDEAKNDAPGSDAVVSSSQSGASVLVIPPRELFMIARETYDLIQREK